MKLWHNPKKAWQAANVANFEVRVMRANPDVVFYQPNPTDAPWHVQAIINGRTLNFWPHLMKGNFERERSHQGLDDVLNLISEARGEPEDIDLIDDDDSIAGSLY